MLITRQTSRAIGLLVVAVLSQIPTVFAQFNYGVRSGLQRVSRSHGILYHVGAFGEYRFNDRLSILGDLLYSEKGSRLAKENIRYYQTYLSVPIALNYHTSKRFSLMGGVEFNYLLSAYYGRHGKKVYYDNYYVPTDWAIVGGLSYDLDSRWNTMLRYTYGLTNISNDPWNNYEIKNSTLQISLGYFLNKRKDDGLARDLSPVSCGVKVGFNLSDTRYDLGREDISSTLVGGNVGMYVRVSVLKFMGIIGEFQYIGKGYKLDRPEGGGRVRLDYLEVPILLSFDLGKRISIDAGWSMGFLIHASTPQDHPGVYPKVEEAYDTRKNDEGVILGLRWRTKHRLSFGGRFYDGMFDISDIEEGLWEGNVENLRSFQFFTYYRLQ